MRATPRAFAGAAVVHLLCLVLGVPAHAATTDCAINWSLFAGQAGFGKTGSWSSTSGSGFVTNYTKSGQAIRDEESGGAGDSTSAANPTNASDLASGSPANYSGPYSTTDFGYYDGGTAWDPENPATLTDDHMFFRWRLAGNPAESNGNPPGLANNKWNVLLDTDADGYKEFWILVDGNTDRVSIYYQDLNRQDINTSVPYVLPSQFLAMSESIADNQTCSGTTTDTRWASHTRSYPVGDGTGDYFLEVQIPIAAFDDMNGNQVLFPDSPVAYVYSTGESNTDPLQKDYMQRLQAGTLNLANPISFGDIVTPSGLPTIDFIDAAGAKSDYYLVRPPAGSTTASVANVYVQVLDRIANGDPSLPDSVTVAVSDPATGDDELLTLWETGSSTGVFTNLGGFCTPTQVPGSPVQGWLVGLRGTGAVDTGWFQLAFAGGTTWTLRFSTDEATWTTVGSVTAGTPYTGNGVSFTLYQNAPTTGVTLGFCSRAADSLQLTTNATVDAQNDGIAADTQLGAPAALSQLNVVPGDAFRVTYTGDRAVTVQDTAVGLGQVGCAGTAIIGFTRSDGTAATNYNISSTTTSIDSIYVTVVSRDANTNSGTQQQITVRLYRTGADEELVTLTETGPNTGVFRNTTGLPARVALATGPVQRNGAWEDWDGGSVTAEYIRDDGACQQTFTSSATVFVTPGGGDVAFTNASGTIALETYTAGDTLYVTLKDANLAAATAGCSAGLPPTVTITATDALGTVHDQLLLLPLTETATGSYVWRTAGVPTMVWAAPGNMTNTTLEAADGDTITVTYNDCNDGDNYAGNNTKTATAAFNAPDLVINRVLFAPDQEVVGCQAEAIEIYNRTSQTISLDGYRLTDQGSDNPVGLTTNPSFDYVFQGGWSLPAGGRAILTLDRTYADFMVGNTLYLFLAGMGEVAYLESADQLTLYRPPALGSKPVDFVAWSDTPSNSADWVDDDSAAVAAGIWGDNQYRSSVLTTDYQSGQSLVRLSDGYDRNLPADWKYAADTTCQTMETLLAATRVTLLGLRSDPAGRVEFRTGTQRNTVSFNVWASRDAAGNDRRLLTPAPIPAKGGDTLVPVQYDADVLPFTERFVLLEEREKSGHSRFMGPFPVGDEWLARGLDRPLAETVEDHGRRALAARSARALGADDEDLRPGAGRRSVPQGVARGQAAGGGAAVRIETDSAGVVTLTAAELQAGGLAPSSARALGGLQLTNLGRPVSFQVLPRGAGITFTAEALHTDFANSNVYVLSAAGSEPPRASVPLTSTGPAPVPGMHRVETEVYYSSFVPPGADPWSWEFAADGWPANLAFDLPGLVATKASVPMRLHVVSTSEHTHTVEVKLNGIAVASATFKGAVATLVPGEVDGATLLETGNLLEVVYSAEPNDGWGYVQVDAIDLGVTVRPRGAVSARVSPWIPPAGVPASAEYLVIAPAEFSAAAQRLIAAKEAEGLRARVVTTEQAYARYSAGIVEPNAIRQLIRDGRQLRYVLLLGDDTIDPLDYTGLGTRSLVPSLYAHQPEFGYIASENLYADRDGDSLPDVAIGRLPANSPEEADTLVDKVLRQDALLQPATGHQTFAADNEAPGDADFLGNASEAARVMAQGSEQTWAALGVQPLGEARASLDAGLRKGGLVHYFGHGADDVWADERLLDSAQAATHAGSGRGNVVFSWTCNAQWYVLPFGPTVNEALMLAPDGGAVATFGPVGVSRPAFQRELSGRLYVELRKGASLGEAIRRAKAETLAADPVARPAVEGFNLLGDPALRLR